MLCSCGDFNKFTDQIESTCLNNSDLRVRTWPNNAIGREMNQPIVTGATS